MSKEQKTSVITQSYDEDNFLDYHFKSHSLIYAATDLTSRMMDVFALMLTNMKESDWRDASGGNITPEYVFDKNQLSDWFDVHPKQLYTTLQNPCANLAEKTIGIEKEGTFKYNPILSGISYEAGTLTITPNPMLKDLYIINANSNGHAKVDNRIFKKLTNPNTKKIFEFLCRYRYDSEMYYITIRKLQIIFGVISEKGDVLKPSYVRPMSFINRVIKPALQQISECEEAKGTLEVMVGEDGHVGYQLEDAKSVNGLKVRFLAKWTNQIPKEKITEMYRRTTVLMEQYMRAKKKDENPLDILVELEALLRKTGHTEQADQAVKKIQEIEDSIKKKEMDKELAAEEKEKERLNTMLESGFFDEL